MKIAIKNSYREENYLFEFVFSKKDINENYIPINVDNKKILKILKKISKKSSLRQLRQNPNSSINPVAIIYHSINEILKQKEKKIRKNIKEKTVVDIYVAQKASGFNSYWYELKPFDITENEITLVKKQRLYLTNFNHLITSEKINTLSLINIYYLKLNILFKNTNKNYINYLKDKLIKYNLNKDSQIIEIKNENNEIEYCFNFSTLIKYASDYLINDGKNKNQFYLEYINDLNRNAKCKKYEIEFETLGSVAVNRTLEILSILVKNK